MHEFVPSWEVIRIMRRPLASLPQVALAFSRYLDLLDLHGRAAVSALSRLDPAHQLRPDHLPVDEVVTEHWRTLEIWAWILANPGGNWQEHDAVPPAMSYEGRLRVVTEELDRLEALLTSVGEDLPVDYFGKPGTAHDVARLLAHEVISLAARASRAAEREAPPLSPDEAADCIDRALHHWSEPEAAVQCEAQSALLATSDTGDAWQVRFGRSVDGADGSWALLASSPPSSPAVTVAAPAAELRAWLEGLDAVVEVQGATPLIRSLQVALGHDVAPEPRRPWWRRG